MTNSRRSLRQDGKRHRPAGSHPAECSARVQAAKSERGPGQCEQPSNHQQIGVGAKVMPSANEGTMQAAIATAAAATIGARLDTSEALSAMTRSLRNSRHRSRHGCRHGRTETASLPRLDPLDHADQCGRGGQDQRDVQHLGGKSGQQGHGATSQRRSRQHQQGERRRDRARYRHGSRRPARRAATGDQAAQSAAWRHRPA